MYLSPCITLVQEATVNQWMIQEKSVCGSQPKPKCSKFFQLSYQPIHLIFRQSLMRQEWRFGGDETGISWWIVKFLSFPNMGMWETPKYVGLDMSF